MVISFSKMHGAGNDFVVVDGYTRPVSLSPSQVRALTNRHFGIGADQLLLVEPSTVATADFRYRIFNCDGGEVEHCGNGARCFAKFVQDRAFTRKRTIRVQVAKGFATLRALPGGEVEVDVAVPLFDSAAVPFDDSEMLPRREGAGLVWPLETSAGVREITVVSMGNPHAVQFVDDVGVHAVQAEGALVESHARFPEKVNAVFVQLLSRKEVSIRVFERGAGETLACGTGASAGVAAGIQRGLLDSRVTVHVLGGTLTVSWNGAVDAVEPIVLAGPAVTVFESSIDLDALPAEKSKGLPAVSAVESCRSWV
jgi:diaminopimelate epimerase